MKTLHAAILLGLVTVLLTSGLSTPLLGHPAVRPAAQAAGMQLGASTSIAAPSPAYVAPAPSAHAVQPATPPLNCPTPSSTGAWTQSGNFFSDLDVNITVPGDPALSGSGFQTVPCTNTLPTYSQGIWVNVSTDVSISSATMTVWALGWSTPTNPTPPLNGFSPTHVARFPMLIANPTTSASFFVNTYRFFWPGTQVFFNLTVNSTQGVPNTVRSTDAISTPENYSGVVDNATWEFGVAPAWPSANFSDDLSVASTPSALGGPQIFDPNPSQSLQITLTSLAPSQGGVAGGIGAAELFFNLTGALQGGPFDSSFQAVNRTVSNLSLPIGPYPNSGIQFQIMAWTLWEGGDIDPIRSQVYTINWTDQGGWWYPDLGVGGNLDVTSTPNVMGATATVLPTGTPVNVTIHSPLPNVTISSAAVVFYYQDSVGFHQGVINMRTLNDNTTYLLIPGLPPGGQVTFSIVAKDVFGTAISSGNYTYSETGPITTTLEPGYGLVYIEAVDISTGQLVPSLSFTIQNGSWSEHATGTPLGFASIVSPGGGSAPFPLAYGSYSVSVSAFNEKPSGTVVVSGVGPQMIVFDLASGSLPVNVWSAEPALEIAAVVGLAAAAILSPALIRWFRERRAKAEAEQRRVTLG